MKEGTDRREFLKYSLAAGALLVVGEGMNGGVMAQSRPSGKMMLCIHQNTSQGAGYRKSLEGWAKAGIKYVELTDAMLDEFLKTDTLAAAKNVPADLGLTPVCAAAVLQDLWIPGPCGVVGNMETTMRTVLHDRITEDLLPVHHEPESYC